MEGGIMEKLLELWFQYRQWCLIGLGGLLVIILFVFTGMRHNQPVDHNMPDQFSSSVSQQSVNHAPRWIYVDVKGAVDHPGVIKLAHNARVEEALKVVKPCSNADLKQVNLAKQLTDQQVLYIPKIGEQATTMTDPNNSSSGGEQGAAVNINTAGKSQLCEVTGIGDKKADLILQYRQEHGEFKSVDDLKNISGFGEKTVAKIKSQLAV